MQIRNLIQAVAFGVAAVAAQSSLLAGTVTYSFENPYIGGDYAYNNNTNFSPNNPPALNLKATGFSYTGASGITAAYNGFNMVAPVSGNQAAFIQGAGSSISTFIYANTTDLYNLTFYTEGRNGMGPNPLNVYIDGILAVPGLITPASSSSFNLNTITTNLSAGGHKLSFVGAGTGDVTTFVDSVTVPVPLPSSVVCGVGLLGGIFVLRKRIQVA